MKCIPQFFNKVGKVGGVHSDKVSTFDLMIEGHLKILFYKNVSIPSKKNC